MQTSRAIINTTDKAIYVYTACGKQVLLHPFSAKSNRVPLVRVLFETYNEPRKDFRTDSVNIADGSVKLVQRNTKGIEDVLETEVAECSHGNLQFFDAGTRVPRKFFTDAKWQQLFPQVSDSQADSEDDASSGESKSTSTTSPASVTFQESRKKRIVVEGPAADAKFVTAAGEITAQDVRTGDSLTIASGDTSCGPWRVVSHHYDRTTLKFKTVLQTA